MRVQFDNTKIHDTIPSIILLKVHTSCQHFLWPGLRGNIKKSQELIYHFEWCFDFFFQMLAIDCADFNIPRIVWNYWACCFGHIWIGLKNSTRIAQLFVHGWYTMCICVFLQIFPPLNPCIKLQISWWLYIAFQLQLRTAVYREDYRSAHKLKLAIIATSRNDTVGRAISDLHVRN
jgi:hypothetical protein